MLVYRKCECVVMQMLYVVVLCATCGSSQCCVLHDLQSVNTGQGIPQSRSHDCLEGSYECLLLFTPSWSGCLLMVDGMPVVVYVMLSLTSVWVDNT